MEKEQARLLKKGHLLPLVEEFYSIQGEGYHTGKAAYFIRLGGCDIGCEWCDTKSSWNADSYPLMNVEKIVKNAVRSTSKSIVVTGGEPLMYNLDFLCNGLKKHQITTFIETSGTHPITGIWDWICLSPKKHNPPLTDIYEKANELKMIISKPDDFVWAEENLPLVKNSCKVYLQPEWSVFNNITPGIIEYIKKHPIWNISLQIHKFLHIP